MKKQTPSQIRYTRQTRLTAESDAYRILGAIIRFHDVKIKWTIDNISNHTGIDYDSTARSVYWLVMKGFLEHRNGQYYRTISGDVSYNEVSQAIHFNTGCYAFEFRTEVLTGMDKDGEQTTIDCGALPDSKYIGGSNREEDAQIATAQSIARFRKIAIEVGQPLDVTMRKIAEGSIRRCNKCQRWEEHHRHNGSNGKQFQSICIVCRKKGRK